MKITTITNWVTMAISLSMLVMSGFMASAAQAQEKKYEDLKLEWSSAGKIPGKNCLAWNEGADPHSWLDNYLCSASSDMSKFKWSSAGKFEGMQCYAIKEAADPHSWLDNYFCVPVNYDYDFRWFSDGNSKAKADLSGMSCLQISEGADPHSWLDNHLCYGLTADARKKRNFKIDKVVGGWKLISPSVGFDGASFSYEYGVEKGKEVAEENSDSIEKSVSLTIGTEVSAAPLGAGAKATASITGGLAFTSTDTKSVAESFTTTQTNGLTEDCNKGAIYQWTSQIHQVCGNGECVPITAPSNRTVCTTPDDMPLRTPDWEPCEPVAYSYLTESNGNVASGVAVNTDAQFRCAWNREFTRNGVVIKTVNISDPEPAELPKQCRSICIDDGQCRSFSLNTTSGKSGVCTLMSDIAEPTAKDKYLTGKVPPKPKAAKPAPVAPVPAAPAPAQAAAANSGTDDIMWRHETGKLIAWNIENGNKSGDTIFDLNITDDWQHAGVGDFDGDGHDDMLWRHDNGQVHYWKMQKGKRIATANIEAPVGSEWQLLATGDLDGDGTDDVIWQNDAGQVHYWKMQNGKKVSAANIDAPVSSDWNLMAAGDIDGDNTDDIIFRNDNGQVVYWKMQGGKKVAGAFVETLIDTDKFIFGAGDVDGDGTDDLIWQGNDGQVFYWKMQAAKMVSAADIENPVGSDWEIAGIGNLN